MALKLYSTKVNPNTYKVLVTAKLAGVEVEMAPFEMGVTNKTPDFLKLNPIGKIPVLVTPSGPVFESNAIARYIARLSEGSLYGASTYESAVVDEWIDFATNEFAANVMHWAGPLYGFRPRAEKEEAAAKEKVERALGALNSYLSTRTFLVGDSITVADVVLASALVYAFLTVFSPAFMKAYPHVQRHWQTMVNQPEFRAVAGELKQVEETPTDVVPPEKNPFYHMTPAGRAAAAASAPSSAPPSAAETKEAEAVPATPPQAESSAADDAPAPSAPGSDPRTAGLVDEEEAPKPKAKNPLDLLPKSSMVMDEWKRLYSNTKAKDFKEVAIKGFWNMYDPEGYSLWFCDYQHNDENTVKFITLNKVSGFLQRMDLVRKYAFAKMCILGPDSGPFSIRGVWLFRGPEVPKFVMEEVYDMELYDWKQVDINDEKQKALVNDMFEEPDEIDGQILVEAKCFK